MQKVVVVWLSTNMSRLYENGGLFYNYLCMQNKSRFFRWKDSFEEIWSSWRTADWPFSSRIACVGWLKTIAWDDWKRLHGMMFIGKSYVIAIIKFIIEQLFADFTINSFKCCFSIQSEVVVISILRVWLYG